MSQRENIILRTISLQASRGGENGTSTVKHIPRFPSQLDSSIRYINTYYGYSEWQRGRRLFSLLWACCHGTPRPTH